MLPFRFMRVYSLLTNTSASAPLPSSSDDGDKRLRGTLISGYAIESKQKFISFLPFTFSACTMNLVLSGKSIPRRANRPRLSVVVALKNIRLGAMMFTLASFSGLPRHLLFTVPPISCPFSMGISGSAYVPRATAGIS